MAFASKTEQLRLTCISFALEINEKAATDLEIGKIIYDAEEIYKWVIGKETECQMTNLKK